MTGGAARAGHPSPPGAGAVDPSPLPIHETGTKRNEKKELQK